MSITELIPDIPNELVSDEIMAYLDGYELPYLMLINKLWRATILIKTKYLYCVTNFSDETLSKFTNLTALNLSFDDKITDKSISGLTNLEELSLSYNHLVSDNSVSRLTNLTSLNITMNECVTNESLSLLTNLEYLSMARNMKITDSPISMLTNLTILDIHWSKITAHALTGLTNLTTIYLDEHLSSKVDSLTNLTSINICDSWC